MKQTAVEFYAEQEVKLTLDFLANKINQVEYGIKRVKLIEQAKAMERSQKAEEYLKGFKDGKEYQIKLDELTFKSE
jgi:hypothetical protein